MPSSAPSTPERPWPVQRRFFVDYHDLDVLNHLNHARYFVFMQSLRCDYYLPLVPTTDPAKIDIIMVDASCRFLAPANYGTELVGEVVPARPIGRTSFTLLYRFHLSGTSTVTARGKTVSVVFDYGKGEKQEIPPARRAVLERDAIDPASEGW